MEFTKYFKRYELKFLLTPAQYAAVRAAMTGRMTADEYGKSTILNVYFDTPDHRLIRRSLERPVYKEKLRLRSYGIPKDDDTVFLELKKKYESVVYKRREPMTYRAAREFLAEPRPYSQVTREIAYFLSFYRVTAAVGLSYMREAFFGLADRDLRITFDTGIRYRDRDVSLASGTYGAPLLPSDLTLMEIKTASAIPLWLTKTLSCEKIYKTSFSKYGRAYLAMANTPENQKKTENPIYA